MIDRSIIANLICVAINAQKPAIDIPKGREDPVPFIYCYASVLCKFVCSDGLTGPNEGTRQQLHHTELIGAATPQGMDRKPIDLTVNTAGHLMHH